MGHTINPITWRLGELIHWQINFFSSRLNYSYLLLKFYNIFYFTLFSLFRFRRFALRVFNFSFFRIRICLLNSKLVILVYLNFKVCRRSLRKRRLKKKYLYVMPFLYIYGFLLSQLIKEIKSFNYHIPKITLASSYFFRIPSDYRRFFLKIRPFKDSWEQIKEEYDLFKGGEASEELLIARLRFLRSGFKAFKRNKFETRIKFNSNFYFKYLFLIKYNKFFFNIKKNYNKYFKKLYTTLDINVYNTINPRKIFFIKFFVALARKLFITFYIIPIFNFWRKTILHTFLKIEKKIFNFQIYFLCKKYNFFSANLIARYMIRRLSSRRRGVRYLMNNINDFLNAQLQSRRLAGFRISVAGRLTKKERALYFWQSRGLNSTNTKIISFDYHEETFPTWFSICMLKIWLFY